MSPELADRPFTAGEARAVVAWAYEPPFDVHDLSGDDAVALLSGDVRVAVGRFGATRVRAAVAAFNDRSLRLCTAAGFRRVHEFEGPEGRFFVELELVPGQPAS